MSERAEKRYLVMLFLLAFTAALAPAAAGQSFDWDDRGESTWYAGRYGHDMAYINDNHIVMFGGSYGAQLSDTAIYSVSSNNWFQICGVCDPEYREDHAMCYIAEDRVLMFGGSTDYNVHSDETWVFHYNGTWTQVDPATAPSPRFGHAMAYIGDDKALLFGGKTGIAGPINDTWLFDLSDNTWTPLTPPASPGIRYGAEMAYLGGDRVLLYGGFDGAWGLADTWIYDLSDGTWTEMSPASWPGPRFNFGMARIGDGQVVLNGGYGSGPGNMGAVRWETFVYDEALNTWTEDVEHYFPDPRWKHAMCATSMTETSKAVLFAGAHNWLQSDLSRETWAFGGGDYVIFPDLNINASSPLITPSFGVPGETVTAAALTLRNTDNGAAGPFDYGYYLSADAVIDATDLELGRYSVGGLAGGAEQAVAARALTIPMDASGYQYFGVKIDVDDDVGEANEGNNTVHTAFELVNTPPGSGVVVTPRPGMTVEFDEVTDAGNTSAVSSEDNPGPENPGYMFQGEYLDITTTATYSGAIEICVEYDDTGMTLTDEFSLRLFHLDGGVWIDVTTGINANDNIICGTVTSLSWFGMGVPRNWVATGPGTVLEDADDAIGISWVDYDLDGDQDLYLVNHMQGDKLLRNDGGGVFADATSPPIGHSGQGSFACWGDYDNDRDPDLYLTVRSGANVLYRNDGGGVFVDVTAAPLDDAGESHGAGWADFDNDGDLDLYVANYYEANRLYRNEGGGVFTDATASPLDDASQGSGVAWADYDDDGDQDIYLTNTDGANKLFRNDGGGAFTDVTPVALADAGQGRAASWGDYDNDRDLDLYLVNADGANRLFRNDGGGSFVDVAGGPLADAGNGRCATWGDYDNDGNLDLYVTNLNQPNVLIRNLGGGAFSDATATPVNDAGYGFGAAWSDFDQDGDLDLYLANSFGVNHLFRNDQGGSNHWMHIRLTGTVSNRFGVGARVRVVTAAGSQIREMGCGSSYLSQNSSLVEFGLGAETVVDTVVVTWPSGIVNRYDRGLVIDRVLVVGESVGGATPAPDVPGRTALHDPVPNPFNAHTTLAFELAEDMTVTLKVYDIAGRLVDTPLDGARGVKGRNEVVWTGRDASGRLLPAGVYFFRLEAGAYGETKRMVLVK